MKEYAECEEHNARLQTTNNTNSTKEMKNHCRICKKEGNEVEYAKCAKHNKYANTKCYKCQGPWPCTNKKCEKNKPK